jgi:hypothetical protein
VSETKISVRKKAALAKIEPLKYTDGKNTWEALPGQPNGCFTLPGHPDELFSLKSLYEMIKKHCRPARILQGVGGGEEVTFADGIAVLGEMAPRLDLPTTPSSVPAGRRSENRQKILNFFHNRAGHSLTKRQISDGTGLALHIVSALLPNISEIEISGKSGSSNLYILKK